jgi:hypothetical protein
VNFLPSDEQVLAEVLEQHEAGPAPAASLLIRTNAVVAQLAELAGEIRGLPPVEPDPAWLRSSKLRLLKQYDRTFGRA